jgi:hypothetical protein
MEKGLSISEYSALRARIFKASGSFDPINEQNKHQGNGYASQLRDQA